MKWASLLNLNARECVSWLHSRVSSFVGYEIIVTKVADYTYNSLAQTPLHHTAHITRSEKAEIATSLKSKAQCQNRPQFQCMEMDLLADGKKGRHIQTGKGGTVKPYSESIYGMIKSVNST